MDTISADVTGSRHLRAGRNGQDAAATWCADERAAIVVCDGCGSGASSEVGARLGAGMWIRAVSRRLVEIGNIDELDWQAVRAEVTDQLASIARQLPGEPVRECLLFTIVSAAVVGESVSVWVLGDGVYALDGEVHVVGPFANNEPPYLGYDLVGDPREARCVRGQAREVVVATDGVIDDDSRLPIDLAGVVEVGFRHPDGLRRQLSVLARAEERIDWEARRVVRTPARLQDDCAIAAARIAGFTVRAPDGTARAADRTVRSSDRTVRSSDRTVRSSDRTVRSSDEGDLS